MHGFLLFMFQVEITHRIVWKRSSTEGNCAQATIDAQTLLPSGGQLTCQSGCSGKHWRFFHTTALTSV